MEKKNEKISGYVQKMTADEIVHQVFLKTQIRLDDMFARIYNLEILIHSILNKENVTEEQQEDITFAKDHLIATLEILEANKKAMQEAFQKKVEDRKKEQQKGE